MKNNTNIQAVALLSSFVLAGVAIVGCKTTHVVHIHNGKPVILASDVEPMQPEELKPVDITMILDRSGSMGSLTEKVISSYNDFLDEQKTVEGEALFTLIQFDDKYEPNYAGVDIQKAGELTTTSYEPRGRTALFDAIGRTIVETKERITPGTSDVVFVITTDGLENASQEYTGEQINELIESCESEYGWHFMFLAANQDAFNQHISMGLNPDLCIQVAPSGEGWQHSQQDMSQQILRYRIDRDATNLEFEETDLEGVD